MVIYVPSSKRDGIGGGLTFTRHFKTIAEKLGHRVIDCPAHARWEVCLVTAPTLVTRGEFRTALQFPGKVVLRVDGVPEDWRNKGTGWPRLRDFAKYADEIVYQSQFIRDTVGRFIKREEGKIIYNGTDTKTFRKKGAKFDKFGNPSIIHVNYRKDPNKRWDEVIVKFREFKLDNPTATITFVGNYPEKIKEYHFGMLDYECRKDWQYLGIIKNRQELAKILRSGDFFAWPSFADPMPNTLLEALHCGLKPVWTCDYGSTNEIINLFESGFDFGRERMVKEYLALFESLCK